jgi:hypothetical protein
VARYSASFTKTTGAAAAWQIQVRQASTTKPLRLLEFGLWTTTAVAGTYGLSRGTAAGATFTSVAGLADDPSFGAAAGLIDTAATTAPTGFSTTAFHRTVVFPASIGSGVVWTFGPNGLTVAATLGMVLYQSTAAAVGLQGYAVWDE